MPQSSTVTALIDQGLAAQESGDISTARQKFEAALEISPDDPEALHLFGLVHEQENDRDSAIELIERAIAIDPQEPMFRLNLAAILETNRQFDLAADHLRAAANARPNSSDLSTRLGVIELLRNDGQAAAAAFQRAYELDQQNIAALAGFGRAMLVMNNVVQAKRAAQAAFRDAPQNPATLELALRIACQERDGLAIGKLTVMWKFAGAGDKTSLTDLSNLLFDLGYTNEACSAFEAVVALDPHSAETLTTYGRHCTAAQKYKEAGAAIDKALAIDPKSPTGLFALSRLKYFIGDLEASEELCGKVIDASPQFPPAYTQLCTLRRGDMSDAHITAINALVANTATLPDQSYELLISLAKIYDRRNMANEAFSALQRGNDFGEQNVRLNGGEFSARQCTRETDQIISLFQEPADKRHFEPAPYRPIFIVGMPRSGTTVTESILAAHPDTFSIGELSSLPEVAKRVLAWASQSGAKTLADAPTDQLQSWRELYFSYFPSDEAASFMIDKQPINFRHAGLIQALFPESKIIHTRRNPVETGFSIYRHPFNRQWPFSFQQKSIAHFYGDYARIVDHWEQTLQADFPLFQYENLVAEFEKEVRRMLAHCDLDWHDECLSFHRTQRPIATFSSIQARQPIRKAPEHAAQRYIEHLNPLLDGLAVANVDLETGALIRTTAA